MESCCKKEGIQQAHMLFNSAPLGIPWQSSAYYSELPLQGAWVWSPAQGTKVPHVMWPKNFLNQKFLKFRLWWIPNSNNCTWSHLLNFTEPPLLLGSNVSHLQGLLWMNWDVCQSGSAGICSVTSSPTVTMAPNIQGLLRFFKLEKNYFMMLSCFLPYNTPNQP